MINQIEGTITKGIRSVSDWMKGLIYGINQIMSADSINLRCIKN